MSFRHLQPELLNPMAARLAPCSSLGPSGVRHAVEVTAESLYETAILGVTLLRNDGWADQIAPATQLEIQVRQPATTALRDGGAVAEVVQRHRGQLGRDAEEVEATGVAGVTESGTDAAKGHKNP